MRGEGQLWLMDGRITLMDLYDPGSCFEPLFVPVISLTIEV